MGEGPGSKLWNAAELRERNKDKRAEVESTRPNAQTARDVLFTFPAELSAAGRLKAARIIAGFLVSTSAAARRFQHPSSRGRTATSATTTATC